jgi:hypothetical protein
MTGFIFDLARSLAGSTAASLRQRADGPPLSRAEIMAVTTLLEVLSVEPTAAPAGDRGWAALERQARMECDLAQRARRRPSQA